ncbi:hypothetical protein PAXINDRAFT_12340 [Paxillus involutus ATCC 200175]|uniref:Unplaced genomic scaffold PAXINscaffold_18, whole genome shotgun sequence n=1 Tax=Paxillus involutus ATCC 200175 TaxID=664439 RepID=A0A0C9TWX4_PAXIN|nr:hypothetical protein PAXINDRAFT_12340 [Paxillus involutus ATCC 200175]
MSTTTLTTSATALTPTIDPLDERASCVRFNTQCVVIPERAHRSRMPRVVTKSYSLPLWKRRASSSSFSGSTEPERGLPFEENHVVLRVPLPSFSTKAQSPTRSADHSPLTPCLVHRSSSHGSSIPGSPPAPRRTRKTSPSPSRTDVVTVPLRPCCAACQPIAEAALVHGDAWTERFSRAANRRRSISADGPRTITVAGSAAAASLAALGHGVPISVDEVDKRRRASDTGLPKTGQDMVWLNDAGDVDGRKLSFLHASRPGVSTLSADARPPASPTRVAPSTPRIPEEEDDDDKDQLFPLPSPKRSPVSSPAPSPAASLSSLTVGQVPQNSTNSPSPSNGTTDCRESPGLPSSKSRFLVPPTSASSSSLSLPKTSESTVDLTEDPPRAPSPDVLSALPSISARSQASPGIFRTPPTPIDTKPSIVETRLNTPRSPTKTQNRVLPITIPAPRSQSLPSPQVSPTRPMCSPNMSTSSFSPSTSPTLSVSPNSKKSRGSFSMASSRHIIADVLRGVGAMGSGGAGLGMGI